MTFTIVCLAIVLFAVPGAGQCVELDCGDCNSDGRVDVLDSLAAALLDAGLALPSGPEQVLQCDAAAGGTPGVVDVLDALVIAQRSTGLPVSLECVPVTHASDLFTDVANRDLFAGDPDVVRPNLACVGTTVFYEVQPSPGTEQVTVRVHGMSAPTDVSLLIGAPATPPGNLTFENYFYYSQATGPEEEMFTLACGGLAAQGGSIAVAVHSIVPGLFSLEVTGDVAGCTCASAPVVAGGQHFDFLETPMFICPPDPAGPPGFVDHWELTSIPPGTTRVSVHMVGPPPSAGGDYDLLIGNPGVCGGDQFLTNYRGTAPSPSGWGNPLFLEEYHIDGAALAAYGSGPLAVGVAAVSGPPGGGAYTLDVLTSGAAGAPLSSANGVSPVQGSISPCRVIDWTVDDVEDRWRFTAFAGQTIEVFVDTDPSEPEGAFDPRAALFISGQTTMLASGYDELPCAVAPPHATGTDCPHFTYQATTTAAFDVSVARAYAGNCRDAANGRYVLRVTVEGQDVALQSTLDDAAPASW